ncbi:MAG: hypothetical protein SYR96_37420 [Actinomycetota bacterium]|nr:hypothetical protein [Actinomycetota bacterium]
MREGTRPASWADQYLKLPTELAPAAPEPDPDQPQWYVNRWIPPLRQHVDDLLDRDWGLHTRAALLQTAAHAALNIDYSDVTGHIELTLEDLDTRYEAILEAVDGGPTPSPGGAAPLVDRDAGMRRLVELTDLLPRLGARSYVAA